jgi:chorismate mutase
MTPEASVRHADVYVAQMREQISDNDRAIIDAINRRLRLVAQLMRYKQAQGLPILDPSREEWMLRYLLRANRGPLSEPGLREIYAHLLDLTKREVHGQEQVSG